MSRMIDNYPDRAEERDGIFVRQVVANTRNTRSEFREWIQQELIDLVTLAQLAESTADGVIKDGIREDIDRLKEINLNGLRRAVKALDEEIERVSEGSYDDVLDAYHYLQDATSRLERFMRQILEIKERYSAWIDSNRSR